MKARLFFLFLFSFTLFLTTSKAQEPINPTLDTTEISIPAFPNPVSPTINIDWLVNAENGLYAGLVMLLSFLSFWIPGVKKIKQKVLRTLAIAASLGLLMIGYKAYNGSFKFDEIISLVISYLVATGFYDKIFKPIGLVTPQPDEKVENEE